MSLPVQLSVGQVSIYGLGSINGIVNDKIELKYGRVDQMYNQFGTYRDWETDRKSTRLNSSHRSLSRMPSSA